MTEPNTIVVVDQDGRTHWAARQSAFVVDGLADGTLREVDDAPVPAPSADLDTDSVDDGSGDGQPDPGPSGDGGDDSVAGPTPGGGARKRS